MNLIQPLRLLRWCCSFSVYNLFPLIIVYVLQLTRIRDTSAAEARAGKDIQGIPWERIHIARQDYRKARLEQYKNYENFPQSGELMDKVFTSI